MTVARGPLWQIGRSLLFPIVYGFFRLRRSGHRNIPKRGATLIVSNHLSVKDPPIVGMAAQPRFVFFMAKSGLFSNRVAGWILRGVGAFPVERGAADRDAIRFSREILARGEGMIMFPEGTRSLSGNLRPFFTGAGALALEPGVTVIPTAIWGSQTKTGRVTVVFGEPLDLSDLTEGPRGARIREATARIAQAVADLVPLAGGPPQTVATGTPSLEPF